MLRVVSKQDAVSFVLREAEGTTLLSESVPLDQSVGRVLSVDLTAQEDVPSFDRSTVDGFAVFAADTFGAGEFMPAELTIVHDIRMGEAVDFSLRRGCCARIATGGMLPAGADAVIMVEHTQCTDGLCLAYASVSPGENITKRGDDVAQDSVVLKKGSRIGTAEIGVLAALGFECVPVLRKPIVAVISTGDELTGGTPKMGQVRDINSALLSSAAKASGCEAFCYGAVNDDREMIEHAVVDCLSRADVVLISGGSSAGTKDMTVQILDSLGTVHFHGIAMKPGKPTIFATVENKPVFGLPGHPLAAFFVFRLIVCAYIRSVLCMPDERACRTGILSVNLPSNHGREEFLCVKIDQNGSVLPLHSKSGVISVLSQADGFICVPRNAEGLAAGSSVEVFAL